MDTEKEPVFGLIDSTGVMLSCHSNLEAAVRASHTALGLGKAHRVDVVKFLIRFEFTRPKPEIVQCMYKSSSDSIEE